MSLEVSQELLTAAADGRVSPEAFAETIRTSLPGLWKLCTEAASKHAIIGSDIAVIKRDFSADKNYPQIQRGMASTSVHAALDAHFGGRFFLLEEGIIAQGAFAFCGKNMFTGTKQDAERRFHDMLHEHTSHRCGKDGGDDRPAKLAAKFPLGYKRIEALAAQVHVHGFVFDNPAHLDEGERMELLALMATHLNRRGLEWHFRDRAFEGHAGELELGFVNCCGSIGSRKQRNPLEEAEWKRHTSVAFQVLNQSPVKRDC